MSTASILISYYSYPAAGGWLFVHQSLLCFYFFVIMPLLGSFLSGFGVHAAAGLAASGDARRALAKAAQERPVIYCYFQVGFSN